MTCKELNITPLCEVCGQEQIGNWICWIEYYKKRIPDLSIDYIIRISDHPDKRHFRYAKIAIDNYYPELSKKIETYRLLK